MLKYMLFFTVYEHGYLRAGQIYPIMTKDMLKWNGNGYMSILISVDDRNRQVATILADTILPKFVHNIRLSFP